MELGSDLDLKLRKHVPKGIGWRDIGDQDITLVQFWLAQCGFSRLRLKLGGIYSHD